MGPAHRRRFGGLVQSVFPATAEGVGHIHIKSTEMDAMTDYRAEGENFILKNGKAFFAGAEATFTGTCQDISKPFLQITGQVRVDADKLLNYFKKSQSGLKNIFVSGILNGPFVLNGFWDKPLDWDLKVDANGAPVYFQKNYRVEKFQTQVRMKNRVLNIPFFRAAGYDGSLGSEFHINLASDPPVFESQFYAQNINLEKIAADLDPPKKNLKGILMGKLALAGQWQRPDTFQGSGSLSIAKGLLWQTNQFKAMGHLPLVKVEGLELVTFEEMSATFHIQNKKIHTEDLAMFGDTVDLSLRGAIGFDQSLDLIMNIQYSNAVFEGASITGGLAPIMVQQATNFISEYKLSGTLKKPTFEKMILPSGRSVGKKLTDVLRTII